MFRKKFYIPLAWRKNQNLINLIEFRYSPHTSDMNEHFKDIKKILKEVGYDKNETMIHDYIHESLSDLLKKHNIPHITETHLRQYKTTKLSGLTQLLGGLTPDIIMKGKLIVDVYVGCKSDLKQKYNKLKNIFQVEVLTLSELTASLHRIFDLYAVTTKESDEYSQKHKSEWQSDVDHFFQNLQLLLCEHEYWMSCLKLGQIIRNEYDNITIKEHNINHPQYDASQDKFMANLEEYAQKLNADFGIDC